MPRILLIEDDEGVRRSLSDELSAQGHHLDGAGTVSEGFDLAAAGEHDVVLLDLHLPDGPGEDLLPRLLALADPPSVIVLTAHGSIDRAVRTMRDGAFDFLEKPCRFGELSAVIGKAAEASALRRENRGLRRLLGAADGVYLEVGQPEEGLRAHLDKIAASDLPVLITGETGVGKEVVARWIHHRSPRRTAPFLVVDCAALQGNLIESELFGHEKGAFTGAHASRAGLVEMARAGSLFLDEIGELDAGLQAKLLRLLETGEYRRVGGRDLLRSQARVLAATHRNLEERIQADSFREDLYYRLNVLRVEVPALRERRPSVPGLARHFLERSGRPLAFDDGVLDRLADYDWPGNVRELRNVIERIAVLADGDRIRTTDLPPEIRGGALGPRARDESLEELERVHILRVLETVDGNRARAAGVLGISPATLYNKLRKYREEG